MINQMVELSSLILAGGDGWWAPSVDYSQVLQVVE